ncbi:hypothetical protein B0I33_114118 [Prauserella shujinwangii]|uniref:DUF6801 domain-containing protein n=1 Tax=Prauserella shujinwangii TaxID=1453103 RepID=A0A2T0LL27_9PSEU|nr:DUF6801 domain-containing protein [Prauserella shujinwangii]PRX43657.1 hypothetical protein B0I33_114118 [Prauserella shujinwangii]
MRSWRWSHARGRCAALAASASVLLATAAIPAPPGTAAAAVEIGGECPVPGGDPVPVTLSFTADLPATLSREGIPETAAVAGVATLPASAVTALHGAGATAVTVSASATLALHRDGAGTAVPATLESTADLPLPAGGDWRIPLAGKPVPLAAPGSGDLTVELAALTPTLTVHSGTGAGTAPCATGPGQGGRLGTVAATPAAAAPAGQGTAARPAPAPAAEPEAPLLTARFLVDTTTRVAKLGSDLTMPRGTFDAGLYPTDVAGQVRIEGDLAIPPGEGYFVVFRFLPVTSTVTLTQNGRVSGTAGILPDLFHPDVDVTARLGLAVSHVRQDGVPLEVGDHCRTERPLEVRMRGKADLTPGARSTFESVAAIPRFTGCGVHEDLDPLLSGLISGPGNEITTVLTTVGVGL